MISHRAFLGEGDRTFTLTDPMVTELEALTGTGIGAVYRSAVRMELSLAHTLAVIRLGLIGGGTSPQNAARLVTTYGQDRPLAELYPLALDVLDARWSGTPAPAPEAAQ